MRLSRDILGGRLPGLQAEGSVLSIGAFDGLHLGHQAILQRVVERAKAQGRSSAVLSFAPLPREYFGQPGAFALTSFRQKFALFHEQQLEHWLQLRFNAALATLQPEEFVKAVLVDRLNAREVHVGEDFRFGAKRAGDFSVLQALGKKFDFTVHAFDEVQCAGARVSASKIRAHLAQADFASASRLLGRGYSYQARVQHGQKLGRTLGFPTANLPWPEANPLRGIFAVRVNGAGVCAHPAVASLGTRPAVNGEGLLLEVHLFDFSADLYGKRLEVQFVQKLRDEANFSSLDALVQQIEADARAARVILAA